MSLCHFYYQEMTACYKHAHRIEHETLVMIRFPQSVVQYIIVFHVSCILMITGKRNTTPPSLFSAKAREIPLTMHTDNHVSAKSAVVRSPSALSLVFGFITADKKCSQNRFSTYGLLQTTFSPKVWSFPKKM